MNRVRCISLAFLVPRADWEKIALPGSKIWVDVSSCTEVACAKPVSATFAFPETEVKDLLTDITVVTTIPAAGEFYSSFCYVVGETRRCGPYVIVLKS